MKIGSTPDPAALADVGRARAGTGASASASAAAPGVSSRDEVAFSAAASQMSSLASGDFDSGKVDAIRQAIREGRFSINPEAIADRLIADASALLAPRTPT